MIRKIIRLFKLWNPWSKKLYVYYRPFVEGETAITVVKSYTIYEGEHLSPGKGKQYYRGKYLEIEDLPTIQDLEGDRSLSEKLSRRLTP